VDPPLTDEWVARQEEKKEWEEMDPSERPLDFIPRKFSSLRQVCLRR
jgi:ribosome biogenesis protein ERB1